MSTVQPRSHDGGDEELGAVRVLAGVGHRQEAGLAVLDVEVLICLGDVASLPLKHKIEKSVPTSKLLAVDRLATGAVVAGEVASLEHELGDDAVEPRAGVAVPVLPSAQLAEVARGLGDDVVVQLEHNAAAGCAADGDIELRSVDQPSDALSRTQIPQAAMRAGRGLPILRMDGPGADRVGARSARARARPRGGEISTHVDVGHCRWW